MVVSSGQNGEIINRKTGQVSDSLRHVIYMKADSIARGAAREIDSMFEKPIYITMQADTVDNPEFLKHAHGRWRKEVWLWKFQVLHGDTTFSHVEMEPIK